MRRFCAPFANEVIEEAIHNGVENMRQDGGPAGITMIRYLLEGQRIQALRESLGLTQLDVAQRIGVSERTIRNAETGRPIRYAIAEGLAATLQFDLLVYGRPIYSGKANHHADGAHHQGTSDEPDGAWVQGRIVDATVAYLERSDPGPFLQLLHPEVEWHCQMTPNRELAGSYSGRSGVEDYLGRLSQELRQFSRHDFMVARSYQVANVLTCSGTTKVEHRRSGTSEYWWNMVFLTKLGQIYRFEQSIGLQQGASSHLVVSHLVGPVEDRLTCPPGSGSSKTND